MVFADSMAACSTTRKNSRLNSISIASPDGRDTQIRRAPSPSSRAHDSKNLALS
jgi:hypothetical protein